MDESPGSGAAENGVVADSEANAKTKVSRAPMSSEQSSLWCWGLAHNPGNDSRARGLPGMSRYAVPFATPTPLPRERARLGKVLSSNFFAIAWAALMVGNIVLLAYDVDTHARGESSPTWNQVLMIFILLVYVLEIILRLYVSRLAFFEDFWNNFDFVWVMVEAMAKIVVRVDNDDPLMSALRVLGALGRVVRIFRIFLVFKDLYLIVQGMLAALQKILWASLVAVMILVSWSIFAVEFIHPLNVRIAQEGGHDECERCKQAFHSVMDAMFTFMGNVLAGERWDTVCIPIMDKHPWTAMVFLSVLFCMHLALLSLILAVLVDGVHRMETDVQESGTLRAKQLQRERAHILRLFRDIDVDTSGAISLEKLVKAFDTSKELASFFALMDIHREDLAEIVSLLQAMHVNGAGEMSCPDLVDQLISMKMLSPQRLLLCNSYSMQNKITDGMRSIWESSPVAHATASKPLSHLLGLMEQCDSPLKQGKLKNSYPTNLATIADAATAGSADQFKAFGPQLVDEWQGQDVASSMRAGEEEVQRCMDRLRRSVDQELGLIASTVAASLREAATCACEAASSSASTALPRMDEAAAFTVVDETPVMKQPKAAGLQDSARKHNPALLADQVQKDLLKFQTCINESTSLAADKLGLTFPDNPVARDFQVALVQLQLRLNEGLSMAMADVMTKVNPSAQRHEIARLGAITADLLQLPSSSRKVPQARAALPLGALCGRGSPVASGTCCGRRSIIMVSDGG